MEPRLYGWWPKPKIKRIVLLATLMLFTTAYAGMRVLGLSVLCFANPFVGGVWLATLFGVFTLIKMKRGTITFYALHAPFFITIMLHVMAFFTLFIGGCLSAQNVYAGTSGIVYTSFHIRFCRCFQCFLLQEAYCQKRRCIQCFVVYSRGTCVRIGWSFMDN